MGLPVTVQRPRHLGPSLSGELEIQTSVFGKRNGITALIVPSKQGLAAAIAGSCIRAEGRLAPPAKSRFHGNEEQLWVDGRYWVIQVQRPGACPWGRMERTHAGPDDDTAGAGFSERLAQRRTKPAGRRRLHPAPTVGIVAA